MLDKVCEKEQAKGKTLLNKQIINNSNSFGWFAVYETQTVQLANRQKHWRSLRHTGSP